MVRDEPLDGLDGQQRHVTGQDQDRAVGALGPGLPDCVTAAEPLGLDHGAHVGSGQRHDVVRVRSDDQHDAIGQAPRGTERIGDERATAEWMENLGLPRAHPLAFSGGENDGRQFLHGVALIVSPSVEITS